MLTTISTLEDADMCGEVGPGACPAIGRSSAGAGGIGGRSGASGTAGGIGGASAVRQRARRAQAGTGHLAGPDRQAGPESAFAQPANRKQYMNTTRVAVRNGAAEGSHPVRDPV